MEKENPNTKRIQKQDLELGEQDCKQGNPTNNFKTFEH
jgi:hypothetical protein